MANANDKALSIPYAPEAHPAFLATCSPLSTFDFHFTDRGIDWLSADSIRRGSKNSDIIETATDLAVAT